MNVHRLVTGAQSGPFPVARFATASHHYLYDAATNEILRVPESLWKAAPDLLQGHVPNPALGLTQEEENRARALLSRLQVDAGVLVPGKPERVVAPKPDKKEVEDTLFSLLLNVTEACNIRCTYCVYGGAYAGKRRHNNKRMSLDVAKNAIDHLAAHSGRAHRDVRMLGWYGGEPLMNFPLIRESAAYFRKTFAGYETRFHMTSNAVFWPDEVLDFLIEHDVALVVSLDGPRVVQDRQRLDAQGQGTFDRVMANIERLRARDESYFRRKVSISVVATPPLDLEALDAFFAQIPVQVSLSTVEPTQFGVGAPPLIEAHGLSTMQEKFIEGCLSGVFRTPAFKEKGYNFVYYLFIRDMERLHKRQSYPGFSAELMAHGTCAPGAERLFVTADGYLDTCEKTDGSAILRLGDLENGVSPERCGTIFDDFNAMEYDHCRSCFNVRLCQLCFAHAQEGDQFTQQKRAWNCNMLRERTQQMLSLYCRILERDPTALDFVLAAE